MQNPIRQVRSTYSDLPEPNRKRLLNILEDISNRVFSPKIYTCIGTPSANFRSINSNKSPIELKFIGEFSILTILVCILV